MIVIKNKADVKIEYPIETLSSKDKVIFFDIETTGFSRKYCNIYLIGCMYYAGEQLMYTQWLAENFNDEANVLIDRKSKRLNSSHNVISRMPSSA